MEWISTSLVACGRFVSVLNRVTGARPTLTRWWVTLCVFLFSLQTSLCFGYQNAPTTRAVVNITYKDPVTNQLTNRKEEMGYYASTSRLDSEGGWVVHVRTEDNHTHGCTPPTNFLREKWIALVKRGSCKFNEKIYNAAIASNASAVVIYNNIEEAQHLDMTHNNDDVVAIFIGKKDGERIAHLAETTRVYMHISVGSQNNQPLSNVNKTSVLFVSISFIVLMIISLAWLVFYYIQRFRYAHAKERLSKRLMSAAKKAITKMPLKTIKNGDIETESDFDQCAVCIESYKSHDVVRILPCMHMFHKSCVDPWLIEQRSCPMCKLDILKAYGLQVHGSRDSVANIDIEVPSTSIGPSELVIAEGHRDLDCDSLEIVRYQPAQIEYHNVPSTSQRGASETLPAETLAKTPCSRSLESVHSVDSESNELAHLMPGNEEEDEEEENVENERREDVTQPDQTKTCDT